MKEECCICLQVMFREHRFCSAFQCCLDTKAVYTHGRQPTVTLKCNHTYHKRCLAKWYLHFTKNKYGESTDSETVCVPCPMCKRMCDTEEVAEVLS